MSDDIGTPGHLLDGKYQIVGVVGEGAWGIVLEGTNVRIRRKVAIKILKAEYASRADMVSRFEREALASTHIESPHVVQVYDAGVLADGRPYLVMEFLTGEDLGTHITRNTRLPIPTAVDLCAQVARGLAAAHAAGVYHRDMKPNNVVIARTKSGREIAKIVDFGISKLLDSANKDVSHTQTGTVLGSPVYMSPEQARGSKASDHRSDLYSLGVVLFECLTGRPPHDAEGFNALLFKIALEPAPSARSLRPEIDEELDAILKRLLAKHPDERVQSATELEGLLTAWLRKTGVKFAETPTESGPRVLEGLTTSPLGSRKALSSGQLEAPARSSGLPSLESTVLLEPSGAPPVTSIASTQLVEESAPNEAVAKMVPAPTSSEPQLSDAPLSRSKGPASSIERAPPAGRRGYVLAGVLALVAVAGVAVVATRRPPPAGNGLVITEPSSTSAVLSSTGPEPSGTTKPDLAASGAQRPADTTTADAGTKPSATQPLATRPFVPVAPASAGAKTSASPPTSVAASTAAQPAASAAGSANVGGRTIRTEF